jgi:hypothetical protein
VVDDELPDRVGEQDVGEEGHGDPVREHPCNRLSAWTSRLVTAGCSVERVDRSVVVGVSWSEMGRSPNHAPAT